MTPGHGKFWPQGSTLKNLQRGQLYNVTYQISLDGLEHTVSDKDFQISNIVHKYDPLRQGQFWPQEHNFNKFGKYPVDNATNNIT